MGDRGANIQSRKSPSIAVVEHRSANKYHIVRIWHSGKVSS